MVKRQNQRLRNEFLKTTMTYTAQRLTRALHTKAPFLPSHTTRCNSSFLKQYGDRWPEKLPVGFIDYVNDKFNLKIPNDDIERYQSITGSYKDSLQKVDDLFDKHRNEIYPKLPKRTYETPQPGTTANKFGQWTVTTEIPPTNPDGPLKNKTFGIKDNISVAGLPCRNGSELFKDYTPIMDASLVTRILEAGGTIIGKTQCENLCYSGGSHTSYPHPVQNPHNPLHHSGGSSSGSGCAVAAGSCDIAIGGDQGGSIRLPSSWSGCVGLKPTWGLVPYTGAAALMPFFDHLGPMAKTVDHVVETLKVIGGKDGFDLRQLNAPAHGDKQFISSLDEAMKRPDVKDIKIGVLKQGFMDCEWETEENVRNAVNLLNAKQVIEVDVPMHNDAVPIWQAIAISGQHLTMYLNGGLAPLCKGKVDPGLSEAYMDGMREGNMSSPTNIANIIAGEWMLKEYGASYNAKGTELSRVLKNAYEKVMDENDLDVLVFPTIKFTAAELPNDVSNLGVDECIEHAFKNVANTMPCNITGFPTLSIPVEPNQRNGLPVGMSIAAKNYDDAKCIHVANVYERVRGPLKDL
eukprot:415561_1